MQKHPPYNNLKTKQYSIKAKEATNLNLSLIVIIVVVVLTSCSIEAKEIEWIKIKGGSYIMGYSKTNPYLEPSDQVPVKFPNANKPRHKVKLKTFEISKSEITVGQYQKCVKAGVCFPPHWGDGTCFLDFKQGNLPQNFKDLDQPLVCVDWNQADTYAKWVGGRLPSEAEWEYVAKSRGKKIDYPWGNSKPDCQKAVISSGFNYGCGKNGTWKVCSKPDGNSEQGICDLIGNVAEWTQDWFHGSYRGAPKNGEPWLSPPTEFRVIRGNSWGYPDERCVAARRDFAGYNKSYDDVGFRVVRNKSSNTNIPKQIKTQNKKSLDRKKGTVKNLAFSKNNTFYKLKTLLKNNQYKEASKIEGLNKKKYAAKRIIQSHINDLAKDDYFNKRNAYLLLSLLFPKNKKFLSKIDFYQIKLTGKKNLNFPFFIKQNRKLLKKTLNNFYLTANKNNYWRVTRVLAALSKRSGVSEILILEKLSKMKKNKLWPDIPTAAAIATNEIFLEKGMNK